MHENNLLYICIYHLIYFDILKLKRDRPYFISCPIWRILLNLIILTAVFVLSVSTMLRSVLLTLALLSACEALYFHINESEQKCFLEEVPDDTMIVGIYKVEMFDPRENRFVPTESGFGMQVEIKDPEGNVVLSRTYSAEGRFSYTAHIAGEHTICLHSNSTAWFGKAKLRVNLDFQIGDHAVDYQVLGTKEKLSELQIRVRQLLDQVDQIQKEQTYQRTREERFRQTSETTNQRVLWWAVAQTILLLLMGFWQMRHLKSFFIAKKLV